jgi:hypothetical protein
MFKSGRWGRLVLSLVALISACGVPGTSLQTPTVVQEPPPIKVTQPQPTAVSDVAGPVETAPAENAPAQTPTASIKVAPTEVQDTPTPKPVTEPVVTTDESVPEDEDKGPSEEQLRLLASLESQGPAPELLNEAWLNSEPLKLADLRGKVVLVEFWTFG